MKDQIWAQERTHLHNKVYWDVQTTTRLGTNFAFKDYEAQLMWDLWYSLSVPLGDMRTRLETVFRRLWLREKLKQGKKPNVD